MHEGIVRFLTIAFVYILLHVMRILNKAHYATEMNTSQARDTAGASASVNVSPGQQLSVKQISCRRLLIKL